MFSDQCKFTAKYVEENGQRLMKFHTNDQIHEKKTFLNTQKSKYFSEVSEISLR